MKTRSEKCASAQKKKHKSRKIDPNLVILACIDLIQEENATLMTVSEKHLKIIAKRFNVKSESVQNVLKGFQPIVKVKKIPVEIVKISSESKVENDVGNISHEILVNQSPSHKQRGDRYLLASQMESFGIEFNTYMSEQEEIDRRLRLRSQMTRISFESDEQCPESEINDFFDVSAQLNVFDGFSMDDKVDEQSPPETTQNVINSSDGWNEEISTSAPTQSKQIRAFEIRSDDDESETDSENSSRFSPNSKIIDLNNFLKKGGDYSFVITVKPNFFEVYKNSEGECVVKEGWTYKLRKAIRNNVDLPCSIAFRRAKYRAEEMRISGGYCRQNKCTLQVSCSLPHLSNQMTIDFENYNTEVIHDTIFQEKIAPEQKKEIERKLQGRSAYAVRSELADEILTDGNSNIGSVPTSNALRVIKCKSQTIADKQNAVLSMYDLLSKHLNCIQRIDLYPFATQYSTPAQVSWYKNEFRGKKRSTISIDATGPGLVSPTNLKKYIFLYVICAHGSQRTLPVAQLLSQSHDSNYTRFWLSSWFTGLKKPDEVIIDQSKALITATVQTFTLCVSMNHYSNALMEALLNNAIPPSCFIRFDRSHVIHSIINNKVIRKLPATVKRLILGVIGFIIQCDSIDTVKVVLQKLFTLIKNPMGTEQVSDAKLYLSNLVRTHMPIDDNFEIQTDAKHMPIDDIFEMEADKFAEPNNANNSEPINPHYQDTLAYKWVNSILSSVGIRREEECPPTMLANIYHSEQLQQYLLQLFVSIPMWSNIMCGVFGSSNYAPSSSASESEFKNLKKLSGIKTKLVNVFVDLHLTSLRGFMKIELCEQNHRASVQPKTDQKREKRERSSSLPKKFDAQKKYDPVTELNRSMSENDIILKQMISKDSHSSSESDVSIDNRMDKVEKENWRNKNNNTQKLRRSRKSMLNRHDVDYKYNNVPLLKNAYTSPRKIDKKIVDVFNSCAFDCTLCIYTAVLSDYPDLREQLAINESTEGEQFSNIIRKTLRRCHSDRQLLIEKTSLLYELYSLRYKTQVVETENTISIDGMTTYGSFLKSLFADMDSLLLSSITEIKTCPECDYNFQEKIALGNNNRLYDKIDLKRLSKYISYDDSMSLRCRKCNAQLLTTVNYSDIIVFDVEPLSEKYLHQTKINEVQAKLHMNGNIYELFAVVEFKPSVVHFVAHVKRADETWESYDDLQKEVIRSRNCTTIPIYIFAVFYKKMKTT